MILYSVEKLGTIDVLRILHDSMDMARHVPDEPEGD